MELLSETPFEVGWLTWSPSRGRTALTVVVKATFDLPAEGAASIAPTQRVVTGDEHHDDDVERSLRWASDLDPLKPCGECWVVGSFRAPSGVPAPRSVAAFSIGPIGKQLAISGPRTFRRADDPAPIAELPLTWEHAFGGPGYDANPVGRGLRGDDLPCVEDPQALVVSRDQRPAPAGCAPIPRTWRARARFAGSYDERWLAERYPAFAEDLDYRYFLAAPEDQRIDGFWRGDEAIRLRNLHPAHPLVQCTLPGLRARAFLVRRGELGEVSLRLDTIAIDADAGQAVCVWRGVADVASASLDDVERLFVVHESLDERRSPADFAEWHARALEERARADREEAEAEAPAEPPAPELVVGGAAASFLDPDAPGAKWAHLDQALTLRGDDTALQAALAAELERRRAEERDAAFRPVFDDALGFAPRETRPELSPEEQLALEMELALGSLEERPDEGRERVRAALAAGESCAGWDLSGADLSRLELADLDLRGAILTRANLSGAFLRGARLDGASLNEAELSDAIFENCSLVEAALSPARAERVRFHGCRLDGAIVGESYLRNARFVRCSMRGAELAGSDLSEALFEDCEVDAADLSGVLLTKARFARSTLIDTWLEGAQASGATFDKCDCSLLRASDGTLLDRASFRQANLQGARLARSKARSADFSLANMARADLSEALLAQARLVGCILRGARFDGAVLVQASLLKSDLYQARFEGAKLASADLRGANLYQAELLDADLREARTDLANLHGTRLAR